MPRIYKDGVLYNTSPSTASQLPYDNSDSGLSATNVKSAIDELSSEKMDKSNPVGTGSLSMNRKADTTEGTNSSTFGTNNTASGTDSHAEGYVTTASGARSHAEGYGCVSSGADSHAEGRSSQSSGELSHAQGLGVVAQRKYQFVFGEWNIADTGGSANPPESGRGNYVEIVGNGNNVNNRSNARTLDWSGNEVLAGGLKINGNKDVAIQSDFTPTAGALISQHANFTGGNYSLTRSGKVVVFSFFRGITGSITGNVELAQLPSGFIPYADTRLYAGGTYNGNQMAGSVIASTDGKIYAAFGSNNLTSALTIAGVYICQ